MKALSMLLNVALLVAAGVLLIESGPPINQQDYVLFFLMIAAPFSSLVTAVITSKHRSLISLYLERRQIEEQHRIDSLKREG